MLFVINDLHIGAVRTGGTTPYTQMILRQSLLAGYQDLLSQIDGDLIINGDLFDTDEIHYYDLFEAYKITVEWLQRTEKKLWLVAGNHDLSKNTTKLSSFQFFCKILEESFLNVTSVFQPMAVAGYDAYIIPHLPNQEQFDAALAGVPRCKQLFLHCNFDNKFAQEKDHSLNLSPEVASRLEVDAIIIGHEHQRSSHLAGKVVVPGNQLPSSVSDCLGNADKHFLKLDKGRIEFVQCWVADGDFDRQDWRSLKDTGARFIRVEGECAASEAAQMISAVSKFRTKSKALVITTSGVKVQGMDDQETLEVTLEEVKGFSIKEQLIEFFKGEPEMLSILETLLKKLV